MTDITLAQRIERFDSYFRSANGVPANARISVPTSEWLELHAALAGHKAQDLQRDADDCFELWWADHMPNATQVEAHTAWTERRVASAAQGDA